MFEQYAGSMKYQPRSIWVNIIFMVEWLWKMVQPKSTQVNFEKTCHRKPHHPSHPLDGGNETNWPHNITMCELVYWSAKTMTLQWSFFAGVGCFWRKSAWFKKSSSQADFSKPDQKQKELTFLIFLRLTDVIKNINHICGLTSFQTRLCIWWEITYMI